MMNLKNKIIILIICILSIMPAISLFKNINNTQTDESLDLWLGRYQFEEFAPPNISMQYDITIYKILDKYYADLSINGFQTSTHLKADVLGNEKYISLVFYDYFGDNISEFYNKGDILIELIYEKLNIYTEWKIIRPILYENQSWRSICFKKIGDQNYFEI